MLDAWADAPFDPRSAHTARTPWSNRRPDDVRTALIRAPLEPEMREAPPTYLTTSERLLCVVGDTGFEPVTASVSSR